MNKNLLIKSLCIVVAIIFVYPTAIAHMNNSSEIESDKTVSISYNSFNTAEGRLTEKKITEITLSEAERIKNKLIEIENQYHGREKIRRQIDLFWNSGLISGEKQYDSLISLVDRFENKYKSYESNQPQTLQQDSSGYIFSGPSIETSLTIGGQTYQLQRFIGDVLEYYFDIELFDYQDNDTLNGTHFHSSAYSGPVFVGISPASAFITTLGVRFQGPSFVYSPFVTIRVLFGGAHLSAKIYECVNPITVFDWHLNAALMGVLVYQSNVIPDFLP